MENQLESCELHYEKVVNYFIRQHSFPVMSYDDFFCGYDLFKIGVQMGFRASASILLNCLEMAYVQTTIVEESQNVLALVQVMSEEFKGNSRTL